MKKQHLAILGGAALIVAFVVAASSYKRGRTEEIRALTQPPATAPAQPPANARATGAKTAPPPAFSSPLVRPYSQSSGPADARVTLVEFFDPGCETCRVFADFVKGLLAAHPGRLRLVLRYAPFHQGADTMVAILEAARRQGKYWETLQVMYDSQQEWASHHHPQPERIWEFLPSAGVNLEKIRQDMHRPEIQGIVVQDMEDARTLGVNRTPAFFVNGKPLTRFGFPELTALVEAEIAAAYGG